MDRLGLGWVVVAVGLIVGPEGFVVVGDDRSSPATRSRTWVPVWASSDSDMAEAAVVAEGHRVDEGEQRSHAVAGQVSSVKADRVRNGRSAAIGKRRVLQRAGRLVGL